MDVSVWRRLVGVGTPMRPMGDKLPWAAKNTHLNGIPRRCVFLTFGAFAKLLVSMLNKIEVHNAGKLLELVRSRPPGTPLITVSNHMSTLDDPLMWGFPGFPTTDANLSRWILAAEDICFTNSLFSYFFRLGKCIPIKRGAGIDQPNMNEALYRINQGDWLHTFPEGKVYQDLTVPMRRFKWGVGSLIARASVTPVVLPIAHTGFEKVMPEKYLLGRRPIIPLMGKKITMVIGEPMHFDIAQLKKQAQEYSPDISGNIPQHAGKDSLWIYSYITRQIQDAVEELRSVAIDKSSTK